MKWHGISPFDEKHAVIEGLPPMIYAFNLTGDKKKAEELVRLIRRVEEMGLTFTIAYDDERELLSATDKLSK